MAPLKDRLRAAGIHLGLSLVVALLAAALVFGLWYPYPYREVSGGRELFVLLVSVDVVLGPVITLFIFDRRKPWPVLRRDLGIVALLQTAALLYGLSTVFSARPVHLVFEHDRFTVVHAVDVATDRLDRAPVGLQRLALTGPSLIAMRPYRDNDERVSAAMAEMQGARAAARPEFWMDYARARAEVVKAARPVSTLRTRFPAQAGDIDAALRRGNLDTAAALYLPMVARRAYWTIILDPADARPVAYLPIDPF